MCYMAMQVHVMSGRAATPEFMEHVQQLCRSHQTGVMELDKVKAYYFGLKYLVSLTLSPFACTCSIIPHDLALSVLDRDLDTRCMHALTHAKADAPQYSTWHEIALKKDL